MKKTLFSLFAFCALTASAENEIETFFVYEENQESDETAENTTKVVNHTFNNDACKLHSDDAFSVQLQGMGTSPARIGNKGGTIKNYLCTNLNYL